METFSPAQSAYLSALAAYQIAAEDARAHMMAFDAYCDRETAGMSEDQADAWLRALCVDAQPEPVLVAQSRARDVLTAAENALIAWGIDSISPMATEAQRRNLEVMRGARHGTGRDRVVALMMKLDGRTLPARMAA